VVEEESRQQKVGELPDPYARRKKEGKLMSGKEETGRAHKVGIRVRGGKSINEQPKCFRMRWGTRNTVKRYRINERKGGGREVN